MQTILEFLNIKNWSLYICHRSDAKFILIEKNNLLPEEYTNVKGNASEMK